jgi:hypothetical protein
LLRVIRFGLRSLWLRCRRSGAQITHRLGCRAVFGRLAGIAQVFARPRPDD